jgi:hypothetical protein
MYVKLYIYNYGSEILTVYSVIYVASGYNVAADTVAYHSKT